MKTFRQWTLAALILCIGSTAFAQEPTAKDLISYRQGVMEALGKHVGAISMMIRGKVPYDHMIDQANALAATANTVGDVFPAGSNEGRTDALPAIWEQEEDFRTKVTALEEAATNFASVAASGDKAAIGKALGAVGGSCKGCHDDYKQAD